MRTFSFVEGDERAMIKETEESKMKGGVAKTNVIINKPARRGSSAE